LNSPFDRNDRGRKKKAMVFFETDKYAHFYMNYVTVFEVPLPRPDFVFVNGDDHVWTTTKYNGFTW
jgi:hypothetical protein